MTKTTRRKFLKTALAGAGAGVAAALPAQADDYITPVDDHAGPGLHRLWHAVAARSRGEAHHAAAGDFAGHRRVATRRSSSLEGIITPNGLHYERHHNGVPDIDPATHKLLIHGLVNKPLEFTMDALMRYPRSARIHFLECGGNSGALAGPQPVQADAPAAFTAFCPCSEWTGVKLGLLLDEAGVQPEGKWILAESGDAASLSRSIPLPGSA